MLPEDKRSQLDNIVKQMVANQESDSNIQFVVDDFKSKYTVQEAVAPKKTVMEKVTNTVNAVFPGEQLGKAVGRSVYGLGQAGKGVVQSIKGDKEGASESFKNFTEAAQENLAETGAIAGDVGQIALTAAAPAVGGATPGARIAANAALGAGIGATGAIADKESAKDVLTSGVVGGVAGGALSAVGEGLRYMAQNAPKWFTKMALPKLQDIPEEKFLANKAGGYTRTPQDIVDYTLENTKVGSLKSIYNKSNQSVSQYGKQVSTILSHPEYAKETGQVAQAIPKLIQDFPDAELDSKQAITIIKKVVPQSQAIVDKVGKGTATLAEQNTLRQQLDIATKKVFTDNPDVSYQKQVAAKLANILRSNVQNTAPETTPIFNNLSKELNLNKAILQAAKKRKVLGDLIAGGAGYAAGGLKGAATAIALERTVRNPSVLLAGAKAIRASGKAGPALTAVGKAAKAPILRQVTK